MNRDVKIQPLDSPLDDIKIWLVNGKAIRDNLNIDFALGGHNLRYGFIPSNEVWIDSNSDPKERECLIIHEYFERQLMAGGILYEPAHNEANKLEAICRKKEAT